MEAILVGLVVALAGGAGGELGRQLWTTLGALVRRSVGPAAPSSEASDFAEMIEPARAAYVALEQDPSDTVRAKALVDGLLQRSAADALFASELQQWQARASVVLRDGSQVSNTISGGVQYGPVFQGRDFTGPFSLGAPRSDQPGSSL